MQPIRFGVWGLGRIGAVHCRHFAQAREMYELVAVCDQDRQRTDKAVEHYRCAGYLGAAEFLGDPNMELVIIATRSLDHAVHAEQALAAGKRVLLEKPIGVTDGDLQKLRKIDKEYPGKLFFGHNHRFEPAFMNARAIVDKGWLGRICVVKIFKHHGFVRRDDWQMRLDCGGGQLSVWGPHLIDQGLQLLNAPVREVRSYLRRILTPGDADDHVKITLIGENDTVVELEISNSVALTGPYCVIYGDRGTLLYGQDQKNIRLKYLDPQFQWPETVADAGTPATDYWSKVNQGSMWIEETRKVEPDTNMWAQVEIELALHLYRAMRMNIPFPITSEQAFEVVWVTERVKKQNPQFNWKQ